AGRFQFPENVRHLRKRIKRNKERHQLVTNVGFFGAERRTASAGAERERKNYKLPYLASQMRVAFSRIAWNTGCKSPGDELMTSSTSEVAVCWSNDWRSSFSSRAFSIAITAWSAKFFRRAICFSEKGLTSWR